MRGILIVLLVLGMTSMAGAALVGDVWASAWTINVDISGATTDLYLALAVEGTGWTLTNFAAGADAPSDSSMFSTLADAGLSSLGTGELWAMADFSPPYTYDNGQWLTATVVWDGFSGFEDIKVYEVDESLGTTLLDSLLIPEPMTIALLGLGGLFLRRRK